MKIPRFALLALAALALGIAAAGCGGSSSSSAAPASGTNASSGSSGPYGYGGGGGSSSSSSSAVTVKTASSPLGTILVDQDGKTLYLFEADSMNKSNCSGGCLALWPAGDGQRQGDCRQRSLRRDDRDRNGFLPGDVRRTPPLLVLGGHGGR